MASVLLRMLAFGKLWKARRARRRTAGAEVVPHLAIIGTITDLAARCADVDMCDFEVEASCPCWCP